MIISLGGSIVVPEPGVLNLEALEQLFKVIRKLKERTVFVVGGGAIAREYINALNKSNNKINNSIKDEIGIFSTILNAKLVASFLGIRDFHPYLKSMKFVLREIKKYRYAVVSGWKPGFSSDYVSAYISKKLGEKELINLTSVGGIYTKDPKKYIDAKLIKHLTWNEYFEKFDLSWNPGLNAPFDPIAAMLCKKEKIKVFITNVDGFIQWKRTGKFNGTLIT